MFRILSLELVHWDYWQQFTLPLNAQIITIAGPNGSGKTTLLDGLRTVLGLPCSAQRDYKRYLRHSGQSFAWLRAVVDNRARDGRWIKPFHPQQQPQVTLFCRFIQKGGEWRRDYLIEDGDVPISPSLADSKHWVGVEGYRRRLAEAGLSAAVAKVLALEQGETDKLCEYSAKDLLNLVFTVFGDKEPLDNYQKARDDLREGERSLEDDKRELSRLENELETLNKKADNHAQWKRLKRRRETLAAEVIPTLTWCDVQARAEAAESEAIDAEAAHAVAEKAAHDAQQALSALQAEIAALESEQSSLEANHHRVLAEHEQARDTFMRTESLVREHTDLTEQAQRGGSQDAASLAASLAKAQADHELAIETRGAIKSEVSALRQEQAALQGQGAKPVPNDVARLRQALSEAGIAHHSLVELVSLKDERWRVAVESMLRPYPHLILLARLADEAEAWAIGERLGYRHFVTGDREPVPRAHPGSLLEVVQFAAPVPAWLVRSLNQVQRVQDAAEGRRLAASQDWITAAGYHRERRGARDIRVPEREHWFGEGGRLTALAAVQAELSQAEARLARAANAVLRCEAELRSARECMSGVTALQKLAAKAAEYAAAMAALPTQQAHKDAALDTLSLHLAREKQVAKALGAKQAEAAALAARETTVLQACQAAQWRWQEASANSRALSLAAHEQQQKLPEAWLAPDAIASMLQEYGSLPEAKAQCAYVEGELERGRWEEDALIEAKRDKYAREFASGQQQLAQREGLLYRLQQLTEDARDAYISVLRRSVSLYGHNIRRLGELAGIEVRHEAPHLANDDAALAQAGLQVRFNFDGKGLMGMNDGEASGGQQVMKSLILLMGLMMDELSQQGAASSGGFVFIDEPFAHLDIVNIDRVGTFLRATQAQYLITTPLTHNVNVYQPTDVLLCTYKKKPGAEFAPPVAVMPRRQPSHA